MLCDIHTHAPRQSILSVVDISHSDTSPGGVRMFSIGIHPKKIGGDYDRQLSEIERIVHEPNCVGVGECGLDKFADAPRELQEKVFAAQLAMAQRHGKPVIIHCVRLYTDALRIIKLAKFDRPAIFHGYNGNPAATAQLQRLPNTYFSFAPTLQPAAARSLPMIPLHRILTETDCDKNADLAVAIAKIAEIKGVEVGEVEKAVLSNFDVATSWRLRPVDTESTTKKSEPSL